MELRSAKRRKVSNAKVRVTVEIDKKAQTAKDEILESPKQTASASDDELIAVDVDGSDVQKAPSARTTKSTRRKVALKSDAKATATQSPSKGTRSRERPRELAQPRDEEASESSRKNTGSSSRKSRTTRTGSTRSKHVDISEPDEVDDEPSEPERRVTRGRSRQAAKKATGSTSGKDEVQADTGSPDLSGEPDDSYDPVAAQLQQDIEQNVAVHDETQETDEPLPTYAEKFQKACESRRQELEILSRFVLEKLTGKRLPPLKGLNSEYQKVYQLIEQTVTAGEGNSMLIMGSRGSGKTAMVESIIAKLSKTNKDDFHVVRLNGFLQTDDRLALREIWRQLGRETNTEDEASKINSYADTMATLLALLSHPEEIFGKSDNPDTVTTAKSVIIILDEFDLFAAHHRQTLLYNLFDIAQARKAPLAVIGLTTKVDVTENLEKRVKSRFSHRYVFLPLPKTFEAFSEICLSGLSVADEELEDESVSELKSSKGKKVVESWNTFLKSLWEDEQFSSHLQSIYYKTKSVKDFYASALLPLSNLHHSIHADAPLEVPTAKSFIIPTLLCQDPAPLPFPSSMTGSSNSVSLPLSLLLAATRLTALHDPGLDAAHPQGGTPFAITFPAAYGEYVRLLTAARASASASGAAATGVRVWGRDVAREAWEKLVDWGVVVPQGAGNGTTDGKLFRVEVSFGEVAELVGSGGALGRWWRDG
ncbi:hypothetical protein VTN49DRAFT_4153 [Thermomyces lanuginosus]|uniref:uncharacterized protein n=1 Tax=Thermomyces lanuginosus TaxID=5541 RepID=UPI003743C875